MEKRIACIVLNVLSLFLLLGTVAFLLLYWREIPDRVPNSFDVTGQIDGWADKWTLWLMPGVGAAIFVTLSLVKTMRLRSLGKTVLLPAPPLLFAVLKLLLIGAFGYFTVSAALARPLAVWFLPVFLLAAFVPLSVYTFMAWPRGQ